MISDELEGKIYKHFNFLEVLDAQEAIDEVRNLQTDFETYDFTEEDAEELSELSDQEIESIYEDWSDVSGASGQKQIDDLVEPETMEALEEELKACIPNGGQISAASALAIQDIINSWREKILFGI